MTEPSTIEDWLNSCIRCGNCKYVFKEYGPSCPSGEYFQFESYFASGRLWIAHGLQKGELEWDSSLIDPIFACTTCGNCEFQCLSPHREHIIDTIEELRHLAVKKMGALPAHQKFAERIESNHNPYGAEHHARSLVDKHNLPKIASVVYFIGCTSNYREREIRDSTISVLQKAGVDFTIVDEHCCGSPLLRTGQVDEVTELAEHNRNVIQESGAEKVITSCSGCYRTLSKDYDKLDLELDVEIFHVSQFLRELINEGKLKIKKTDEILKTTYHDPCHLARHMHEYDAPREVLNSLPVELVEMEQIRENAWCCGSGGGCKSAYPDWSLKTAKRRIEHAKSTDSSTLVSTCPFCKSALSDADENTLDIIDLTELVDRLT
ncbi:MAG: (Fe-S)-binding protein [Candidatus Thorarchaeota archaeon]|nr:MAG: (Fe-S)-binding protein [Candidatus Thorarchaeota archaeon]